MAGMPSRKFIMKTKEIITIDGSKGEGGGQIFRSSLSLSMCLGIPVRIENIRAGRSKPGLLRQHLACLLAAKEICDAEVEGAALGSQSIIFKPNEIKAGKYSFSVGSAGSTTLIFQTILMPLLFAKGKSSVSFEGGTHNPMAPTFDFISNSFMAVLNSLGCDIDVALEKYGFYPAGGGLWHASINPISTLNKLKLVERGEIIDLHGKATLSRLPHHIAERELAQVKKRCGCSDEKLQQKFVESVGPGNVISLRANMSRNTAFFEAFGEKNISAKHVADKAINAFRHFDEAKVPVCEHLADQLILPLALGDGGVFRTTKPSMHLLTNIDVVKKMMKADIELIQINDLSWEVIVNNNFGRN